MSSSTTGTFAKAWQSWLDRLTPRYVAFAISIIAVAFVAAFNSYGHQVDVAEWAHQSGLGALLLPISVDGMLLVASLAMAEDKANGRIPRTWARVAFWLGAGVSIAANAASILVQYGPDPLSLAVSAWPPVALLIVVEIMSRPGRLAKNPVRVEAGKKAAVTRTTRKSGASKVRTPRAPRAAKVPNTVAEVMTDANKAKAPVSPAPAGS